MPRLTRHRITLQLDDDTNPQHTITIDYSRNSPRGRSLIYALVREKYARIRSGISLWSILLVALATLPTLSAIHYA